MDDIGLRSGDWGLSLSCYFQPHLIQAGHKQCLVCLSDEKATCGLEVFLDDAGWLRVCVGDGHKLKQLSVGHQVILKQWVKLEISLDAQSLFITLRHTAFLGQRYGSDYSERIQLDSPPALAGAGRLVIAAYHPDGAVTPTNFFNGKVEDVRLDPKGQTSRSILSLDFRKRMTSDIAVDVSGYGNHATLVNAPTRAVTGHDWDGSEDDWTKSTTGYGAIHFHEDDLDDARWEEDLRITLPTTARSGAYAVKVSNCNDLSVFDYITFFVRPDYKTTTAKVGIVLSTFTYMAYANERLYDTTKSSALAPTGDFKARPADEHFRRMERRSDLGLSLYDVHRDGSGNVFSTTKRPILNVRPNFHHWALDRPREFSADLIMIGFLERLGMPYDVLTDHDLHYHGMKALRSYSTLLTGSHPEYPTQESFDTYQAFAARGGNLMYLGGNGFYWRSVLDPNNPHRIEVRRGDQGVRTFGLPGGERHHSLDGGRGGLWRSLGRSCNTLFAMGCCGEGVGPGAPYARHGSSQDPKYSWIFDGLTEDELIGTHGFGGGASGDEIDRWDPNHGSATDAVVLGSSTGHSDEFVLFPEDYKFQQTNITGTKTDMIRSDLVYWDTPWGGAVFSVGSMNWYNAVGWDGYQNNTARVTQNVILKFISYGPRA